MQGWQGLVILRSSNQQTKAGMSRKATKFIVLRGVKSSGRTWLQLDASLGMPKIVATLYDEQRFQELEHDIRHNDGCFLEDYIHDWNYLSDGRFSYYSRVAEEADVLVVYEWELTGQPFSVQPTPKLVPTGAYKKKLAEQVAATARGIVEEMMERLDETRIELTDTDVDSIIQSVTPKKTG